MRQGTYRQKCHDIDCRLFEGVERTLPSSVTPWLTIFNDNWDDHHQRSTLTLMQETL
jgi:hypothetical protein